MMTIQPKEYNSKKEYWDYQRKVEYNREQINMMSERFDGRVYSDFGMVSVDEIKNKCRLISKDEHGHEIQDQRITMMAKIYNCIQEA